MNPPYTPLTNQEAILFYRITFGGTGAYPVCKIGKQFGTHLCISTEYFQTRRQANEAIERWADEAGIRWGLMKADHPEITIGSEGIRLLLGNSNPKSDV